MDDENSKQFNTNANVSEERAETFGSPFSLVNSDCSSSGIKSETNLKESERSSTKISDSSDNVSSESITQFSDVTHESFVPHILPTESPPIQVMERTEISDANKIEASIFTHGTSIDWSIASNESLFSIQIGSSSFSKDHPLMMRGDMNRIYRSGQLPISEELLKSGEPYISQESDKPQELYQSGELGNSDEQKSSGELVRLGQTSSAIKGVEPNQNMETSKNISEDMKSEAKTVTDDPNSDVRVACINSQNGTNPSESSDPCNANHHHDGNKIRLQALVSSTKKKPTCPLCPCLYSSRVYCCCKWPSCCCKWSGCSCKWLSWPSCCCNCKWSNCHFKCRWPSCSTNCLSLPSCCCKWPNCCSCKWPSCHFKCPTWSSCCKCHGSNFSRLCCYCCKHKMKRPRSDSCYALMEGG